MREPLETLASLGKQTTQQPQQVHTSLYNKKIYGIGDVGKEGWDGLSGDHAFNYLTPEMKAAIAANGNQLSGKYYLQNDPSKLKTLGQYISENTDPNGMVTYQKAFQKKIGKDNYEDVAAQTMSKDDFLKYFGGDPNSTFTNDFLTGTHTLKGLTDFNGSQFRGASLLNQLTAAKSDPKYAGYTQVGNLGRLNDNTMKLLQSSGLKPGDKAFDQIFKYDPNYGIMMKSDLYKAANNANEVQDANKTVLQKYGSPLISAALMATGVGAPLAAAIGAGTQAFAKGENAAGAALRGGASGYLGNLAGNYVQGLTGVKGLGQLANAGTKSFINTGKIDPKSLAINYGLQQLSQSGKPMLNNALNSTGMGSGLANLGTNFISSQLQNQLNTILNNKKPIPRKR